MEQACAAHKCTRLSQHDAWIWILFLFWRQHDAESLFACTLTPAPQVHDMFERNKAACGYAHMSLVMLNSARDMPAVGASVNGREASGHGSCGERLLSKGHSKLL